ncbi:MAG: 3-hydroxyisobutyrate dehydrogenase [Pseudomonadota bacterium]|jgi:3-hydroxyisobutyrate dehydrogenase-like beta-hydroxyacid dehydrogenase
MRRVMTSETPARKIGMIGLGIMGGLMAETLIGHGFEVIGHDISAPARRRLRRAGGTVANSNTELASRADVVMISVASSDALSSVIDDLARAPVRGGSQIVIDTSTLPLADKSLAAAALKAQGRVMLDCPISGTANQMQDRAWTIYVSGPRQACRKVAPIFSAFTDKAPYIGPLGSGIKLKYAANHLVAIYNVAYAEVINLCRKMGLDPKVALDHFGHSPVLGTGVMRSRVPFMLARDYTPPTMKVEVWQKDMQVIGDMAKSVHCPVPLFQTCASVYTAAMALGMAQQDTACTAEVLAMLSGDSAAEAPRKRKPRKPR